MLAEVVHICPQCRRGGGQPYRTVPQEPAALRVLLRCDACRHRWSLIVPEDSLAPEARARMAGQMLWPVSVNGTFAPRSLKK